MDRQIGRQTDPFIIFFPLFVLSSLYYQIPRLKESNNHNSARLLKMTLTFPRIEESK